MFRRPLGACASEPREVSPGPVVPPRKCLLGGRPIEAKHAPRHRESQETIARSAIEKITYARDPRTTTDRGSAEGLFVRRWTVDRRHGHVVEPQVHGQLTSMVRKMMDGILHHHVPRCFGDDVAAGLEAPRFHQMIV